jgi:predicted ABC-class ATPase
MASSQRKVGSNEEGKKGGLLRVGGNILPTLDDLRRHLVSIEGHGYKAYQTLEGAYDFGPFTLFIDHAQRDPFAPASRLRVRLPMCTAGFPEQLLSTRERRLGLEDFITRACFRFLHDLPQRYRGTGKSGLISIQRPGQEVLERTSVRVTDDFIEARLSVGLPASGRRVLARQAQAILTEEIPKIVQRTLMYRSLDKESLELHINTLEDQVALRKALETLDLVAFVADGAILPRESGASDRPLTDGRVVEFKSPAELSIAIDLPHRGRVTGMAIPRGVTLIVGGGHHGKSTLLKAIERGVYNHIPGDGREFVVTVSDAVKIRAEDGRSVSGVDISPFINNLPYGVETRNFSTGNASGSISQAANIIEAMEVGTRLLLLDEDTSATNFMIRDARMQQLIPKAGEPITPFIDRVRELYENCGISSILVIGGAGDYLDVADRVIAMENYLPRDVTIQAREITLANPSNRRQEESKPLQLVRERIPLPESFVIGTREKIKARGRDTVLFGREELDLSAVAQLVDPAQANAIAAMIRYASKTYVDGIRTLGEVLTALFAICARDGIERLSPFYGQHPGELALPRPYELAAGINRLRRLKVEQKIQ